MPTREKTIYLYFCPSEIKEIINTIHSLKLKTSCGHDNVNRILLKQRKVVISIFGIAINKSMETSVFPSKLKIAKVVPIYQSKISFTNYRSISLLPNISKIYEKQ